MSHLFVRAGLGLVATLAIGLVPAPADAQAVTSSTVVAASSTSVAQLHRRCPKVIPWTGVVTRCAGKANRRNHQDLLTFDGIWAPNFEPLLNGFGVTRSFFVYVGDTPVGWVDLEATLGGTITLTDQYGDYVKGTQRIALYDTRGRLIAWDWITLDWDW